MRKHYKNIEEALKVERPEDKVVKILSNKFAIVRPIFTNGTYHLETIMGLGSGTTVYSYGLLMNMKTWCRHVAENIPNIQRQAICYNFPENGRSAVWLMKTNDNRKYKQSYRKIARLM